MKIEIERSGGFSGIIKKISVDTEKLPKDVANTIEKELTQIKLMYKAPNTIKNKTPDCYYYKMLLQEGNEEQEIEFGEFDVDNNLRRTVNKLFKKH